MRKRHGKKRFILEFVMADSAENENKSVASSWATEWNGLGLKIVFECALVSLDIKFVF